MTGLLPGAVVAWALTFAGSLLLARGVDPTTVIRAELGLALVSGIVAVGALLRRWYAGVALSAIATAALLSSASYAATVVSEPLDSVGTRVTV
ncbi:MAG: hypothetical protein RLZ94_1143, partial [Actinomycetota bacterium]